MKRRSQTQLSRSARRGVVSARGREGFALIASLSLMAVVVLAVVLLASQLRVAVAGSVRSAEKVRTEAAARLCLASALGQLQRYAGPDERVTARAELTESLPESAEGIRSLHQSWTGDRFWTGVWDSRSTSVSPLGYLVTTDGDRQRLREPGSAKGAGEIVLVGDSEDLSFLRPSEWVQVPITPFEFDDGGNPVGWLGWFASDEGVKASVSTVEENHPVRNIEDSIRELQGARRIGWESLFQQTSGASGFSQGESLVRDRVERLSGVEDMLKDPAAFPEAERVLGGVDGLPFSAQYFALTTERPSLLSNTRDGGLRSNLLTGPRPGFSDPFSEALDGGGEYGHFTEHFQGPFADVSPGGNAPFLYQNLSEYAENGLVLDAVNRQPDGESSLDRPVDHHYAPVISELALFLAVYQHPSRDEPAVRYYYDVELFNPYPFPIRLTRSDLRAYTVMTRGLPEIRVTADLGESDEVRSPWFSIDDMNAAIGGSDTRSWLEIDEAAGGSRSGSAYLLPGEVFRLEDPDPRIQSRGLVKYSGVGAPSDVSSEDTVLVEGRPPGGARAGRFTVRLVEGNTSNWNGGTVFEVRNLKYSGFEKLLPDGVQKYEFGGNPDVSDGYTFAFHFKLDGDFASALEEGDLRHPVIDLDDPDDPLGELVEYANGASFLEPVAVRQEQGLGLFGFGDTLADEEVREHEPGTWSGLKVHGKPLAEPITVSNFRHAHLTGPEGFPFAIGSENVDDSSESTDWNLAFDRYFVPSDSNRWLVPLSQDVTVPSDVAADEAAGEKLGVLGGFNVNSTSPGAWQAMLSQSTDDPLFGSDSEDGSGITLDLDNYFVRDPSSATLYTPGLTDQGIENVYSAERTGNPPDEAAVQTFRSIDSARNGGRQGDQQIQQLAYFIVEGIRERGRPFGSLAEFVNSGIVAEAIEKVGSEATPALGVGTLDEINDDRFVDPHDPTALRQHDVIAQLAPLLTARSDTFDLHAFVRRELSDGSLVERRIVARAQRIPEQLPGPFGRKFILTSFRFE